MPSKVCYGIRENRIFLMYPDTHILWLRWWHNIEKDGTGFGYDMETIEQISDIVKIPLIIAGGAGNEKHLIDGLSLESVSAVATANLFNFIGNGLPNARKKIIEQNLNIARWI